MLKIIFSLTVLVLPITSTAQAIVGKWQLTKQSSCIEDELSEPTEVEAELLDDMKSRSTATPQILQLKDNNTLEESTKIINKRKSYDSRKLLYKYNGSTLFVLDKKSQTIIETYTVERLSADSLIISNSARACDTKVFVKIK